MSNYNNLLKKSNQLKSICKDLKSKKYTPPLNSSELCQSRSDNLNNIITKWNTLVTQLKALKNNDGDSALISKIQAQHESIADLAVLISAIDEELSFVSEKENTLEELAQLTTVKYQSFDSNPQAQFLLQKKKVK